MDKLNFPLILFVLTVATGAVWAFDRFYAAKKRNENQRRPAWIEYPVGFFPVLLLVFALRSFVIEPFKIPSSSMRPTLEVGDFILVNKFAYGIRLPIIEQKIIPLGHPKRGDTVVFRYPNNPKEDYIKRVIGLAGDVVEYKGKILSVNGRVLNDTPIGKLSYLENYLYSDERGQSESEVRPVWVDTFTETAYLDHDGNQKISYTIAKDPILPPISLFGVESFEFKDACVYANDGFKCIVPQNHYWVMGDNRDHSADSRYWGFVPDENLRGRAFFIWFNWDDIKSVAFKRVGSIIH
ncbi:MAG: signal peptidase I [Burkholderiales bacterium]|jgi:signal peptidase I|nr:signal peptidase I [Burkholderiales bacterium]